MGNFIFDQSLQGNLPSEADALTLAIFSDTARLCEVAGIIRDRGFHNTITYSKKVFIPLTHLCRDVCHYCTFAQVPRKLKAPYLSMEDVLDLAHQGKNMGCKEALFTLGEKPELRYKAAREALKKMGHASTFDYLLHAAERVLDETGLLPHLNPGNLSAKEFALARRISPSMGMMLESASERLSEKGMPHYGSPDKIVSVRLQTLRDAGTARVPFTTGILIGIGETRLERIESLLAIRTINQDSRHIQEIIIQNFRAKPETKMAQAPEPDLNELLWTIAIARIIFGADMSIQAPPNLSPGVLGKIVAAGINDWGGVSPVTPDFVNPEAPWPHLNELAHETAGAGKHLCERLTIYPRFCQDLDNWADKNLTATILNRIDTDGFARIDNWSPGEQTAPPDVELVAVQTSPRNVSMDIQTIIQRAQGKELLVEAEIVRLFQARGDDLSAVIQAADKLRQQVNGDEVTFVVNRNINYTNICYFKCQFCAFSKGKLAENLRGRPYDLSHDEIGRRAQEGWDRGASEVCMQGGIHPEYTGQTYLDILGVIKKATPNMHIHAFSPLEIYQGAATSNLGLEGYLQKAKDAGLSSLPGTAAEILDDEIRDIICADKLNTSQWLEVMETAHGVGLRSTATIMYGHVEKPEHWARHLIRVRDLQRKTGGFTEFVPLPFVHMEAPMYLKGKSRKGPTFRESLLMHAVARLSLHPFITNIQASWVKMGPLGLQACLNAGCNDLGGTLMNESISRAAGTSHGQETSPQEMERIIRQAGRIPKQRNTLYGDAEPERMQAGYAAGELLDIINTPAKKYERKRKGPLVRPGIIDTVDVN